MFNCSSEIASPNRKVIFSLLEQGRCMMYEGTCFVAPGQEIEASLWLPDVFFCLARTPSTNQVRVMTFIMTCQIDTIGQQCHYYHWQIWERATNKQLLSYNTATLPQPRSQQQHKATPWAWGGISAVYRSLQSVTEDSQSWGCGRIYPDYTASTITNHHEKKS